jgi:Tfp pilus assembly protein PilO
MTKKKKEINPEEIRKLLKEFLVPILCGLTFFILTFMVFRPVLISWGQLSAENRELEKKLAVLSTKAEELQEIDPDEQVDKVELLEALFPSQESALPLIINVNSLGKQNGVVVENIQLKERLGEAASSSRLQELTLDFDVSGEGEKMISFVKSLDKAAPLISITGVGVGKIARRKIGVIQSEKLGGKIYLSLKLTTFYQPLPEFLGSIEQPLFLLSGEEEKIFEDFKNYSSPAQFFQSVTSSGGGQTGREDLFNLLEE